MLYRTILGVTELEYRIGGAVLVFPQNTFEIRGYLDFVQKKIIISHVSSGDVNFLKRYYLQCSYQGPKTLESTNFFILLFFLNKFEATTDLFFIWMNKTSSTPCILYYKLISKFLF